MDSTHYCRLSMLLVFLLTNHIAGFWSCILIGTVYQLVTTRAYWTRAWCALGIQDCSLIWPIKLQNLTNKTAWFKLKFYFMLRFEFSSSIWLVTWFYSVSPFHSRKRNRTHSFTVFTSFKNCWIMLPVFHRCTLLHFWSRSVISSNQMTLPDPLLEWPSHHWISFLHTDWLVSCDFSFSFSFSAPECKIEVVHFFAHENPWR